jgi:mannose-6-phosphate isomerase class I
MYIGLSKESSLECFDFGKANEAKITPSIESCSDEISLERLIQPNDTDCFIMNRITVKNCEYKLNINDSYGVYIVTEGNGYIEGENYFKEIKKGDYFFIPAVLMGQYNIKGSLQIIECY